MLAVRAGASGNRARFPGIVVCGGGGRFLGFDGPPTVSTGFPLRPGTTFAYPAGVTTGDQVKAIAPSSQTARLAYLEIT